MKQKHVDMLSGSIIKGLLAFTVPMIIMNVAQSLFGVADMAMLRIFADDSAVGAVGVCGSLLVLCTSLLVGISAGSNVVVAKRIGEKNPESADRAVMTSILFSIMGGFVLLMIGVFFAKTFLVMTNCPESLLPQATLYFKIYCCGLPVAMFYNFCAAILRAIGEAKRPMYFLMIGCAVKILLTLLFIGVFNFGIAGVAIATILSNMVAGGLSLYVLLKGQSIVHVNVKQIKMDLKELKEILFIGVPTGLQSAMYSLANVVISAAVNRFGADATTGISIANQFDGILYQICLAPSLAVTPFVSQNIGAGNLARVKKIFLQAVLMTVAIGASLGSLSAIFSKELSSIMSSTPAVIAFSQQKMMIISSTYFICGINEAFCGVLRGMRKPLVPMVATFVYMCVLRFVWVYVIFPFFPNLTFLYTVWPVGWTLSIVTLLVVYFPAMSKLEKGQNALKSQVVS